MISEGKEEFSKLCFWLLFATRGGKTRLMIMKKILEEPMNTHRLSMELGLNYRTVEHHLQVLKKNGLVTVVGNGYADAYFPSRIALENKKCIEDV